MQQCISGESNHGAGNLRGERAALVHIGAAGAMHILYHHSWASSNSRDKALNLFLITTAANVKITC